MKTILIIEDEENLCEVLKDKLVSCGYEVLIANNGKEGFLHLDKRMPDLIILDMMLPDVNGLEILRRLRSEGKNVKVIICTAQDRYKEDPEVKRSDVCKFIVKPFLDLKEIEKTIAGIIE